MPKYEVTYVSVAPSRTPHRGRIKFVIVDTDQEARKIAETDAEVAWGHAKIESIEEVKY